MLLACGRKPVICHCSGLVMQHAVSGRPAEYTGTDRLPGVMQMAGGEGVRGCTRAAKGAEPAVRLALGLLPVTDGVVGGEDEGVGLGLGAGVEELSTGASTIREARAGPGSQRGTATSTRQAAAAARRAIWVSCSACIWWVGVERGDDGRLILCFSPLCPHSYYTAAAAAAADLPTRRSGTNGSGAAKGARRACCGAVPGRPPPWRTRKQEAAHLSQGGGLASALASERGWRAAE